MIEECEEGLTFKISGGEEDGSQDDGQSTLERYYPQLHNTLSWFINIRARNHRHKVKLHK